MPARTMERFVAEIDAALEERTGGDPASEAEVKRKLSTIVEQCGWKKRSHERMVHLEQSLVEATSFPSKDLTDLSIPLSTNIRFRRQPLPAPTTEFAREKDLERLIAKNHRLFFTEIAGVGDWRHLAGGTKAQRRYPFGRSYVKPDLVFKTGAGAIVVVEVKLGPPNDGAIGQLRKYLTAASKRHETVRGILVSGKPRSHAHQEVIADGIAGLRPFHIDWIQYAVDTTLVAVT